MSATKPSGATALQGSALSPSQASPPVSPQTGPPRSSSRAGRLHLPGSHGRGLGVKWGFNLWEENIMEQPQPFTVAIDDATLDDLKRRLANARLPEAELVDDWSQGLPAGLPRGAPGLLAHGLRLAPLRDLAQQLAPVHGPPGWPRRPPARALYPPPLPGAERPTAAPQPRLARLHPRVPPCAGAPHGSRGPRRAARGRLSRRCPLPAGLCLQRQAHGAWMDRGGHG